jgi:PAS domain S-box-containing protein
MNISHIAVRYPYKKPLSHGELTRNFMELYGDSEDAMNLFSLSEGRILVQNRAAFELTGYSASDFANTPIEHFYPPDEIEKVSQSFQKLAKYGFVEQQVKMYCKDRTLKDLWIRSYVVQKNSELICLTHTIDISDQLQKRQRTMEEAKLATLGLSAAAMAHELGNALQSFEYNLYMLEEKLSPRLASQEDNKFLGNLKNLSQYMGYIIKNTASYSSQKVEIKKGVSLHLVIDSAINLMRGYLKHNYVSVILDLPRDIPPINVDPNQLQQILVILIKNAVQAMLPTTAREIRIVVKATEEDLTLTIADNGAGIPDEVRAQIFDFFLSTKTSSEGMGMGLAIAKQLADRNNIQIGFSSVENQGTQFRLILDPHDLKLAKSCKPTRLLVVGDRYSEISKIGQDLLQDGYLPFLATSTTEAAHVIQLHKIEYIICEKDMYPVGGVDFAKQFVGKSSPKIVIMHRIGDDIAELKSQTPDWIYIEKSFETIDWAALLAKRAGASAEIQPKLFNLVREDEIE